MNKTDVMMIANSFGSSIKHGNFEHLELVSSQILKVDDDYLFNEILEYLYIHHHQSYLKLIAHTPDITIRRKSLYL